MRVSKKRLRPIRLASEPFPYGTTYRAHIGNLFYLVATRLESKGNYSYSRATLETAHYVLVAGYQRVEDWSERSSLYTSCKQVVCLLKSIISRARHNALGIKSDERKKLATINVASFFGAKSVVTKSGLAKNYRPKKEK